MFRPGVCMLNSRPTWVVTAPTVETAASHWAGNLPPFFSCSRDRSPPWIASIGWLPCCHFLIRTRTKLFPENRGRFYYFLCVCWTDEFYQFFVHDKIFFFSFFCSGFVRRGCLETETSFVADFGESFFSFIRTTFNAILVNQIDFFFYSYFSNYCYARHLKYMEELQCKIIAGREARKSSRAINEYVFMQIEQAPGEPWTRKRIFSCSKCVLLIYIYLPSTTLTYFDSILHSNRMNV